MTDLRNHIVRLIRLADTRVRWREDRDSAEQALKKKRNRYAHDEAYRERIKEAVKRNRASKSESGRKRAFNKDKTVVINGVSVTLLSSGKAAKLIGVSARSLERWEKRGLIPINFLKDRVGRRWYPLEFVMFLAEQRLGRKHKGHAQRLTDVNESWRAVQLGKNPIVVVSDFVEE